MPKKQWLIGASTQCDLVVDQPTVSSRHCRLTANSHGFVLEDLNSTNGTYVNGRRIHGSTKVDTTDQITLGQKIPMPWPSQSAVNEPHDTTAATTQRFTDDTSVSPAVESAPILKSKRWMFIGGGAAVLAVVIVFVLIMNSPSRQPTTATHAGSSGIDRSQADATGATAVANRTGGDSPRGQEKLTSQTANTSASTSPPDESAVALQSPQPPPAIEQLASAYENAIVWLGVKGPDASPIPIASGWLADARTVVTSGIAVSELKEYQAIGLYVFAANEEIGSVPIGEFRVHSEFDPKDAVSDASRFHNVGVAVLESAVQYQCPVASVGDLGEVPIPGEVIVLGYRFNAFDPTAAADAAEPPTLSRSTGTLLYRESYANDDPLSGRLELKIKPIPGTDGAAMFNRSGKVIGVFRCVKSAPHAISVSHLRGLSASHSP